MPWAPWINIALFAIAILLFTLPFTLPFAVGPFIVRRKHFVAVNLTRVEISPDELPPESRDFLIRISEQLCSQGYVRGSVHAIGGVARASGAQAVLCHEDGRRVASILIARASDRRSLYMGIASAFADGAWIVTASSSSHVLLPPNPKIDSANFSWVEDALFLEQAHLRRLAAVPADRPRRLFLPGQEAAYAEAMESLSSEHALACGYRYLDPRRAQYRATWKGAILMAWRSVRWVRRLQTKRRDRTMRRKWTELGMDQWSPPPGAVTAANVASEEPAATESQLSGFPLTYLPQPPSGAILLQRSGESLVIRGGPLTSSALLGRHVIEILASLFAVLMGFLVLYTAWVLNRSMPPPLRPLFPVINGVRGLIVLTLSISPALLIVKMWRDLRYEHGDGATITATPRGLSFSNAPGRRRSGALTRQQIHGIRLALQRGSFLASRRRYRLIVLLNDHTSLPLICGDQLSLLQARDGLMKAMGIDVPVARKNPDPASS